MLEIIAEIGVNHNGSLHTALELVNAAQKAGCDTAKFQFWQREDRYPELRLDLNCIAILKSECERVGLKFLCTPDSLDDAMLLKGLGVDRFKIGSSNVTNLKMLEGVASLGLPVILSSGACWPDELDAAVNVLIEKVPLVLLHCVSAYPPAVEDLNLSLIRRYAKHLDVGFSDHTIGYEAALMALAMGARTFEKHITLDIEADGPDHMASCDPVEMKNYTSVLRTFAKAIGDGEKKIMPCEQENRKEYERFVRAQYEDHPPI